MKYKQNDMTALRNAGVDLGERWEKIMEHIVSSTVFSPDIKSVKQISWWNTGKVGSVSVLGEISIDGMVVEAVLKIQGSKPKVSEVNNIREFSKQNQSRIIRPQKIYIAIDWNNELQFEASIQELLPHNYTLTKRPAADSELDKFFGIYEEYRTNCRNRPWLKKPSKYSYKDNYRDWLEAVSEDRKKDKLGEKRDIQLAERAVKILDREFAVRDLEFVHGHVAVNDFLVLSAEEVVLTSNLYWGWRMPYYDAVFGYHWWMLGMEHVDDLTSEALEKERRRWLEIMFNLSEVKSSSDGERLLNLALLERSVPALMVDRFIMDQTKSSTEVVTLAARNELVRFVKLFS